VKIKQWIIYMNITYLFILELWGWRIECEVHHSFRCNFNNKYVIVPPKCQKNYIPAAFFVPVKKCACAKWTDYVCRAGQFFPSQPHPTLHTSTHQMHFYRITLSRAVRSPR